MIVAGAPECAHVAYSLLVQGRVQGVGLRPQVARLASRLGLFGSVRNTSAGVEIEIEGQAGAVNEFERQLLADPSLRILCRQQRASLGREAFVIVPSEAVGPLATPVPSDQAACERCCQEVLDPGDRRYGYAFTSCAICGPRYSLLSAMPYDRASTGMRGFALCPACAGEYAAPSDRRFHAQTIACPACGPQAWATDALGRMVAVGDAAVRASIALLRAGRILALRGVGGYQLLCDACDSMAVARLRQRKGRPLKPLAVLAENLAEARLWAVLAPEDCAQLTSPAGPIVTVSAREDTLLAANLHPGLRELGLLLPTTPLHLLLVRGFGGPLVCTSGNREGEPLAVSVEEAEQTLRHVAEGFLHHDRPIEQPIDDSVVRVIAGRPVALRLARGLAPWPLEVPCRQPLVALGGQQKASIAVCNGAVAALGPHVGDLDSLATLARFEEHLGSMRSLYRIAEGSLFVSDLHPDFASRTLVERRGLATFPVQHHHAHLCAALLEAGWLDREVLGVAFDGAGLGTDGTVWGGEFLRATARGYRRMARLRPFPLLGGDAAVREPWRVAFALVARALGAGHPLCHQLASQAGARSTALEHLAAIPALAPRTSSAGRLFDGVAALTLGAYEAGFEGYPAMLLEHACDPQAAGAYELPLCEENAALLELDWRPLVRAVVHDRARGEPPPAIAMRFHRGLADAIAVVVNRWPNLPVVLAGGVFQNRLLTELAAERLEGRQVALPGLIPPGDGGLAAGQLVIGLSATALRNPSEN